MTILLKRHVFVKQRHPDAIRLRAGWAKARRYGLCHLYVTGLAPISNRGEGKFRTHPLSAPHHGDWTEQTHDPGDEIH
jgi:hypothetical protein